MVIAPETPSLVLFSACLAPLPQAEPATPQALPAAARAGYTHTGTYLLIDNNPCSKAVCANPATGRSTTGGWAI